MSSLIDVSNSIKESITDKVTHPLLGSLIISWLFFNWKAVYFILFANHDVVYKLKAVTENYSDFSHNFLFPLLSSLALLFLLPLFTASYTRFIAIMKEIQMQSLPELFRPHRLSLEESNSLRDYYDHKNKELEERLNKYETDISSTLDDFQSKYKREVSKLIRTDKKVSSLLVLTEVPHNLMKKHTSEPELLTFEILSALVSKDDPEHIIKNVLSHFLQAKNLFNMDTLSNLENENFVTITEKDGKEISENSKIQLTKLGIHKIILLKANVLKAEYPLFEDFTL